MRKLMVQFKIIIRFVRLERISMFKILFLLFVILSSCFSKELTTVHWNTVSFAPSLIPFGESKNQGYSDVVRKKIIEQMDLYQHSVEAGTVKLAITNLRRLEDGCFSGLNMNDERKQFIYFSKPVIYSFPNELTIKKSNSHKFQKYLTKNNEIDLRKLLNEDSMIFGYVDSRAYNSYVDKLIDEFKDNKRIFSRKGADLTKGLLHMLDRERIDYILEYPTMVKYNKSKFNISAEFIQYPIKNASDLIQVYVGCSKSEYGKKLIETMDQIIFKNRDTFSNAYKKWIPTNAVDRYDIAVKNKRESPIE